MSFNRTQLLVVGFFVLVWIALAAILVFSPEVYAQTPRKVGGDGSAVEGSFLIALSALISFLVVGVFRRWRWTFWLVLIAFFFGVLRLPAFALQLARVMPASGPIWYEALQGVIGAAQFLIAIAMFAGIERPASGAISDLEVSTSRCGQTCIERRYRGSALVEDWSLRRITAVSHIPGTGRLLEATKGHQPGRFRIREDDAGIYRTPEDIAPTRFGTVRPGFKSRAPDHFVWH